MMRLIQSLLYQEHSNILRRSLQIASQDVKKHHELEVTLLCTRTRPTEAMILELYVAYLHRDM